MKKYFLLAGFVLTSGLLMAQNAKLIAEKSGKGAVVMHEVQPKEGLYSLSRIYGVKVTDIAAANGFDRDKGLSVGQKVKIPLTSDNLSQKKGKTPVYYSVSEGESLTSISNRFNKISVKDLKSWNRIEGDGIVKGKDIIVGYFTGTAPAIPADKSADQKSNILGSKSNTKTRQGLIAGTNINIRKGPATDQPVIATAQQDEMVEIIKKINNEWTSVRTKDGVEGYIASQFLKEATAKAESPKKAAPVKTAVISGTNINVRKGPATDQEVVGILQQDEVVDVIKEVNSEWTSVRTREGVEGYIASQFLKAATAKAEPPKKAASVKTAVVSGTNINVRKGPATDQEVVGILQQDEVVDIIKEVNSEWTSIRAKDGVEGFIASRFLQSGPVKAEPKKVVESAKTAKAYGTRINIRKGPSTDQEVVGLAEEDEVLTYLRKVDNDWSEIRNTGGTTGFVATRFLSFDSKPSVAAIEAEKIALAQAEEAKRIADEATANERAIAAAQKKEEERKAEAIVSEKITAKNNAEAITAVTDEAGYFKSDFEKYKNSNLISEHTLSSGIFKTDRGWNDGKYYLLMDNAAPGTIVKLTNPDNNQSVYAKVLGKMKGVQYSEGFDIRISEAAASRLKTDNLDKFNVKVMY